VVTLHIPGYSNDQSLASLSLKLTSDIPVPVNVAILSQSPHEYDREQLILFWNCIFTFEVLSG
jgi:hypothetical protein